MDPRQAGILTRGVGFCQHQGKRGYQEDSYSYVEFSDDHIIIIALADGMGGHVGGATASRIACDTCLSLPSSLTENPTRLTGAHLAEQIEIANQAIQNQIENSSDLQGMGTTLVLLSVSAKGCAFASVGDSPLWIYRQKEFLRLNVDHSMAPVLADLVEVGRMSAEEAENDPRKNALRSALSGDEIELLDVSEKFIPLKPDDILILASDGLQTLSEDAITNIIHLHKGDAQSLADELVKRTLNVGTDNQDNVTVAVLKMADFLDNNSAVLKSIEDKKKPVQLASEEERITQPLKRSTARETEVSPVKEKSNPMVWLTLLLVVFVIALIVFIVIEPSGQKIDLNGALK